MPDDRRVSSGQARPRGQSVQAEPRGQSVQAEPRGQSVQEELLDRMRRTPGLESLVGEAIAVWRDRAGSRDEDATPGWRAFSDAFPTFWEFSNRPR